VSACRGVTAPAAMVLMAGLLFTAVVCFGIVYRGTLLLEAAAKYNLRLWVEKSREHLSVMEWKFHGRWIGRISANILNEGISTEIVDAFFLEFGGRFGYRIIRKDMNPIITERKLAGGANTTITSTLEFNRLAYLNGERTLWLIVVTKRGNVFRYLYVPDYGWLKIIAFHDNQPATFDVRIYSPDYGWAPWKTYTKGETDPPIKLPCGEYLVEVRIMGKTYNFHIEINKKETEHITIWTTTPPPPLVPGGSYWFMDFKDKDELFIKALNQKGIVQWYGTGSAGYWNNMIYVSTENGEEEWLIFKVHLSGGEYAILARLYMTGPGQVEVYVNGELIKTYNVSIGYTDKVLNITKNLLGGYNYIKFHVFNGTSVGVLYLWITSPGAELLPITRKLDYLWPGTIIVYEDNELKIERNGLLFFEGFDTETSLNTWNPNPPEQWGIGPGVVQGSALFVASDEHLNGTLSKTININGDGVLIVYGYTESNPPIIGGGTTLALKIDNSKYTISFGDDAWVYKTIPLSSGEHTLTFIADSTDPGLMIRIDHLMIVKSTYIVIKGLKPGWEIEIKGSDPNGNPITIKMTAGSNQTTINCEQLGFYHWPLKDVTITLYRTSE